MWFSARFKSSRVKELRGVAAISSRVIPCLKGSSACQIHGRSLLQRFPMPQAGSSSRRLRFLCDVYHRSLAVSDSVLQSPTWLVPWSAWRRHTTVTHLVPSPEVQRILASLARYQVISSQLAKASSAAGVVLVLCKLCPCIQVPGSMNQASQGHEPDPVRAQDTSGHTRRIRCSQRRKQVAQLVACLLLRVPPPL